MRKTGYGEGRTVMRSSVMSRRTVLVGPEAPRWDGSLALRPKPLRFGVRSVCSCVGGG